MKNRLVLLLGLLFLSFNSFAQINFEKGYFIDNSGKRTDCLIKNVDWKNNPSDFKYKSSENAEEQGQDINSVQEFGIGKVLKYVRFEVQIDRSPRDFASLSYTRNPDFQKDTLFLKSIVEGKANLYYYEEGNLRRFFFRLTDSLIQQLVYKQYKIDYNQIRTNYAYRQQLLQNFVCQTDVKKTVENLAYTEKDMSRFFIQYNECVGSKSLIYVRKKTRSVFFSIRPGISLSSLRLNSYAGSLINTKFDNNFSFRIGAEFEYVMPFNKNKWSFIVEPTYRYMNAISETNSGSKVEVIYKSLEIPFGFRYYIFFNKKSKLFLNLVYMPDVPLNSTINFSNLSFEIRSKHNLAMGLGYNYHNRLSLELRAIRPTEFSAPYNTHWGDDFRSYSFILGIKI